MRLPRALHAVVSAWVVVLCLASSAQAANFSFEGSFSQDDQLEFFTFSLSAPTIVTLLTLSYGGGLNAAGSTITSGGFDPVLSLFTGSNDPAGLLIGSNNDGTCPPLNNDPVTSACWDSLIEIPLAAGDYTVVLSQSDNVALGATLADGFVRTGQGNFTGPNFLGVPGSFIDANPNQRTNEWALDILNVDRAAAVAPEPMTASLMVIAVTAAAAARRRRTVTVAVMRKDSK